MNRIFRREWGAVLFVLTVLIGAIAVAVSLVVTGAHEPPVPTLPACPSYTPYVATPTPTATPKPTPTPKATATATPSASATLPGEVTPTPSPTPFNPALANCPTAPVRPPGTSASASASASGSAKPSATPSPTPTPTPANPFPTLPA